MVDIKKINFEKNGLETLFCPVECEALELLWKNGDMKVRDIYKIIKRQRKTTLSSIAVMLSRLYEKKMVKRAIQKGRGGVIYLYSPTMTKENFQKLMIEKTVNKLIDSFGPIAVTYLKENFSKEG